MMNDPKKERKSYHEWLEDKEEREYVEGDTHVLEVWDKSKTTDAADDQSLRKSIIVRFDPASTTADQIVDMLHALSNVYRSIGGKGLLIRQAMAVEEDRYEKAPTA